jgi:hypothetical protein
MKTKRITVRMGYRSGEDDPVYEVIKTVDTIVPRIGEVLDARRVNDYCNNRQYSVTVVPTPV